MIMKKKAILQHILALLCTVAVTLIVFTSMITVACDSSMAHDNSWVFQGDVMVDSVKYLFERGDIASEKYVWEKEYLESLDEEKTVGVTYKTKDTQKEIVSQARYYMVGIYIILIWAMAIPLMFIVSIVLLIIGLIRTIRNKEYKYSKLGSLGVIVTPFACCLTFFFHMLLFKGTMGGWCEIGWRFNDFNSKNIFPFGFLYLTIVIVYAVANLIIKKLVKEKSEIEETESKETV